MSVKSQVSKALSVVLPGGALGASIVLALMSQSPAAEAAAATSQPDQSGAVAEQLAAIRSGVAGMADSPAVLSDADAAAGSADPAFQGGAAKLVPTWWGNGGWGRWRFGWGNGGWHNGWHNWGNGGWPNWHNGWHNFWHNW